MNLQSLLFGKKPDAPRTSSSFFSGDARPTRSLYLRNSSSVEIDPPNLPQISRVPEKVTGNLTWKEVSQKIASSKRKRESVEFRNVNITEAEKGAVTGLRLVGVEFYNCTFDRILFSLCVIRNVRFVECNLESVRFSGCLIEDITFIGCSIDDIAAFPKIFPKDDTPDQFEKTLLTAIQNEFSAIGDHQFNQYPAKDQQIMLEREWGRLLRTVAASIAFRSCFIDNGPDFSGALIGSLKISGCLLRSMWLESVRYERDGSGELTMDWQFDEEDKNEKNPYAPTIGQLIRIRNSLVGEFNCNYCQFWSVGFHRQPSRYSNRKESVALLDLDIAGSNLKHFTLNGLAKHTSISGTVLGEARIAGFSNTGRLRAPKKENESNRRGTGEVSSSEKSRFHLRGSEFIKEFVHEFSEQSDEDADESRSFEIWDVNTNVLILQDSEIVSPVMGEFKINKISADRAKIIGGWINRMQIGGGKANGLLFTRATFSNCEFRDVSFIDPGTSKKRESADFSGSQFSGVDFGYSDLIGASFIKTTFSGASNKLRKVSSLAYSNFEGASGLNLTDFSGLNLTGVKLPDTLNLTEVRKTIEQISRHGQQLLLFLSILVAFSAIVTANITEPANGLNGLDGGSSVQTLSPIPWLNIELTSGQFILVFPAVILILFVYFHIFVLRLWSDISLLPAIMTDGRPADRSVYPWILSSLSRFNVPKRVKSRNYDDGHYALQPIVALFMGYFAAPLAIIFMAFKATKMDLGGVAWLPSLYAVVAVVLSVAFHRRIGATIKKRWN